MEHIQKELEALRVRSEATPLPVEADYHLKSEQQPLTAYAETPYMAMKIQLCQKPTSAFDEEEQRQRAK